MNLYDTQTKKGRGSNWLAHRPSEDGHPRGLTTSRNRSVAQGRRFLRDRYAASSRTLAAHGSAALEVRSAISVSRPSAAPLEANPEVADLIQKLGAI